MAFHKRAQSKDITLSNSPHATPLPTYYSQQLPRWTSKSAFEDQKAFQVDPEKQMPAYAHPMAPAPRFDDIPLPPRPQRQRFPRKAVLIPWILVAVFFLTTLWFTSIALGVRLFIRLQPTPTSPTVQEIHVMLSDDVLRSALSAYATVSVSATTSTVQVVDASISMNSGEFQPTITGRPVVAPTPSADDPLEVAGDSKSTTESSLPKAVKTSPTGFSTLVRMV